MIVLIAEAYHHLGNADPNQVKLLIQIYHLALKRPNGERDLVPTPLIAPTHLTL